MAAKKQAKRTSKTKKSSKLSRLFNLSTVRGKFLVFILSFALVGGSFMAYQSFAATPIRVSSYMDWHNSGTIKYTPSVISTDGQVCVLTNFDTYNTVWNYNYWWYVQVYQGHQWSTVRASKTYSANGNNDYQCFDTSVNRGSTYRIGFKPEGYNTIHGYYWLYGYK